MNALKTGALALTLIIVIPILLGFGMASEDVEVTVDKTSSAENLSDLILNSESPYFTSYAGVNNNKSLMREIAVGGGYETSFKSPDWVSVSETYTSFPIYTSGSSTADAELTPSLTLDPPGYATKSSNVTSVSIDGADYSTEVSAPTNCYVYNGLRSVTGITDSNKVEPGVWTEFVSDGSATVTLQNGTSHTLTANSPLQIYRTGTFSQIFLGNILEVYINGVSVGTTPYVQISADGLHDSHIYTSDWVAVSNLSDESFWYFNGVSEACAFKDSSGLTVLNCLDDGSPYSVYRVYNGGWYAPDGSSTDYSFIPVYVSVSHSAQFSIEEMGSYSADSFATFDYMYVEPTDEVLFYYTNGSTVTRYEVIDSTDGAVILRDSEGYYINGTLYPDFTIYTLGTSFDITWRYCVDLEPTYDGNAVDVWNVDLNSAASVRLTYVGGTVEYVAVQQLNSITYSYGLVVLGTGDGSLSYSNVASVGVAPIPAELSLDWTYQILSNDYANPSYGWELPTYSGVAYWRWLNGFSNDYVRFMVEVEAGETVVFAENETTDDIVTISSSSAGMVTVEIGGETSSLGKYEYMMVEFDVRTDTVTVSGLSAWPSMGVYPAVLSTVSEDYDFDYIFSIVLKDASGDIVYRVDNARIMAGTYSTTKDRVLDIYDYFPNDDVQSIVIDSVGVYGDFLTIGGVARSVTNGEIPIGDDSVSVLGMVIRYVYDSGTYSTYVNNVLVSESESAPRLIFGGEWSLTLHRTVTTSETSIQNNWVAGEFAFDQDDFILAMILTSVAVFIGLGLMKGVKIGVLLVVCSAAGIIAFIIA